MCGIVGYVGTQQAAPILLEGLSRLEYRGYDSAGVCVEQNGVLKVEKAKGRLQNLIAKTENGALLPGTLGIGHTRWATHGEPNDTNSHPHVSQNGKIAVVHNGIIENYLELREFLQQKGVQFASQTDTEVVAQLMEYCMGLPEVETVSDALYMVLHRIEGAYALGILCSDDPDHVYAARKDAPLLIGFGEGENFIASDVTALVKYTRDVVYMDDGEVAVLGRDGVQVYNAMELPIEKEHHHIDWEISAAEKGGYEHFMLKEIMEEPEALRRAILPRIKDGAVVFDGLMLDSSRYDCIKIIACGSSYHVGMVGKYNLEKLTRMPVEVILASEFRYCSPIVNERTLAIIISQSGETLDTMAALREAKSLGARILSIVNVVGSSIARESDDVLYTWAGPEIAVATTKAYSTQMAVLDLLAVYLAAQRNTISAEEANRLTAAIAALPAQVEQILSSREQIQYYASQYFNHDSVFFIGRNLDYALGMEGSLKLKEISYKTIAHLLFDKCDVLVVDKIGKNISGDGMDPNVSGRFVQPKYCSGGIQAEKCVILDLTDETHGNAQGIGLAEVTTRRLFNKMKLEMTYPTGVTNTFLHLMKIPMIMDNDREALQLALMCCPEAEDHDHMKMIRIPNTAHIGVIEISEGMLPLVENNPNFEVLTEPYDLPFDENGNLF